ncbi:MAG: GAF domain-containing sensor histidine kinase, partial [Bacteroidetes bacterium]|nr:GAF domain-containing sensor histidine kinase [Bacteroidota bacterium]
MNKLEKKILELKNENVRLRSSVNELKILNEIALTTGRATDIDQILNLIVQKCISVIEAEQGSILLVTDDYKEPFKTIIRQDDSSSLKHTYHIGSNITGCVLLNKEPIIIEDLAKDKRFSPTEEEKKDIHSVLCVPIWYEGGITGLMMLVNKKNGKHFSSNDLTLFTIISVQAGQLIKNLQLQKENFQKIKETEKLHELDSLKTNFFTNISHEFRTPLTLILGPVEKILESTDNEIVKDNAKLIFRSAKRLNKLADQLLDLARIEAGMLKLKASRQNMIGLLKEIVDSFRMIAESKNINLILNAGYNEIIVFLDRDKFEKVISNIISNAFKFTPDKGCVKVEVRQKEIEIEISISDTGIGIPAEQLDKIFDRFYQAGNILHKEYQGSGVGLSLTKELVELHKGKINVESKEGKGTTFNVTFPLGMAHLKPDELCEEPSAEKQNDYGNIPFEVQEKQFNENESKKLTKLEIDLEEYEKLPIVLIIEDNEDVRN